MLRRGHCYRWVRSMGISLEKGSFNAPTPFSIAVAEAQTFLEQLPAGSTASIVVVGDKDLAMSSRFKIQSAAPA